MPKFPHLKGFTPSIAISKGTFRHSHADIGKARELLG